MWNDAQLKEFDKWNKSRPTNISHGITSENINEHMRQLKPNSWHLRGNMLEGMTDMGMLKQTIPTNVILTGTDNGLPIFQEVSLKHR